MRKSFKIIVLFLLMNFFSFQVAYCVVGERLRERFKRLEAAEAAYTSVKDLPYEKIDFKKKMKAAIEETNKVFSSEKGKTYFLAYELPAYQAPYYLTIHSIPFDHIKFDVQLLFLHVTLLDTNFEIIEESTSDEILIQEPGFMTDWHMYWETLMNDEKKNAKYLLITMESDRKDWTGPIIAANMPVRASPLAKILVEMKKDDGKVRKEKNKKAAVVKPPSAPFKGYEGPEKTSKEVAFITSYNGHADWEYQYQGLMINAINGQEPKNAKVLPIEMYILPGEYTLLLRSLMKDAITWTSKELKVKTEAGHSYVLKYKHVNNDIEITVEEKPEIIKSMFPYKG